MTIHIAHLQDSNPPHPWQAKAGFFLIFLQDLQWVVTDVRAWQPCQWCCLLQKLLIFILLWNNHLPTSVLKSVTCAAKLSNFTRSVPPPITDPRARHQPWLYPSSSSPLQILSNPTPGPSPPPEEHVLESRSHCALADGWQTIPMLGSNSQTRSPYVCTSLSRR